MATIVTRSGKGSELLFSEMDSNFTNLNTDKIELTNLSVTDSGGDGSLAYNNSTGVITYTGPSAAEARAHFTAGSGLTLASGEYSIGNDAIKDTMIDFGTGTNQVSSADVPEQTNLYYTAERVDDQVNTLLTAGSNITLTYDDAAGTLTVAASAGTTTTINNNADNRIITGSGTANTLEGESTLLYDGTSLSNTTAPTFTEASTPIQLNGTQPNAGGYNVYKSINTGTSRGGQGYRSNPSAGGSAKVDTHTLFFDLDDDFGLRPGGSYQGDRNLYLQANHTADQLSIYMDGFSTNTIESFDGNNASYARTPIELHGSTTTLKAGGTTALTATSSKMTAGVELDMDGENLKMGGGTLDLEGGTFSLGGADLDMGGGALKDTAGSLNIEALVAHEVTSAATVTYNMNNKSATGLGLRIQGGEAGATTHTSGDLLLIEKAKSTGGFDKLFEVKSDKDTGSWAGATGQTKAENLHLTGQFVSLTGSVVTDGYVSININGAWYKINVQS